MYMKTLSDNTVFITRYYLLSTRSSIYLSHKNEGWTYTIHKNSKEKGQWTHTIRFHRIYSLNQGFIQSQSLFMLNNTDVRKVIAVVRIFLNYCSLGRCYSESLTLDLWVAIAVKRSGGIN